MISLPSFSTIQNRNVNLPVLGTVSLFSALAIGGLAYFVFIRKSSRKSSITKTIKTKTNFRK